LYKVVEQHLETFLAEAREKHDKPLPAAAPCDATLP
jgi:hypothetical protein